MRGPNQVEHFHMNKENGKMYKQKKKKMGVKVIEKRNSQSEQMYYK